MINYQWWWWGWKKAKGKSSSEIPKRGSLVIYYPSVFCWCMILLYVSERFFESGSMVEWHFLWRILKLPISGDMQPIVSSKFSLYITYIYNILQLTYICICYQSLPQPTVSPSSSLHGIGCATPRWRWCFCWSGSAVKCRRRGLLVLNVGNGWEWMGMDGLLGLLIVSQWIPENSLRLALRLVPPGHFWDLFHPMR